MPTRSRGGEQLSVTCGVIDPTPGEAGALEVFHPPGDGAQGLLERSRRSRIGLPPLFSRHFQGCQVDAIQALGVLTKGLVSLGTHVREDSDHRLGRGKPFAEPLGKAVQQCGRYVLPMALDGPLQEATSLRDAASYTHARYSWAHRAASSTTTAS